MARPCQNSTVVGIVAFCFAILFSVVRADFAGTWDKYIQAPSSRSLAPKSVYRTTGNVVPVGNGHILRGPGSSITFDFGQETAGILTIQYGSQSSQIGVPEALPGFSCTASCPALGLGFTESVDFVGDASDDSGALGTGDGVLYVPITRSPYTLPPQWNRGGFRYLTLSLGNSTASGTAAHISGVNLYFTAEPNLPADSLRSYTGYFQCSDDLLNRIWYAGVYTVQLCTIAANTSVNQLVPLISPGWAEDATVDSLTSADMILADGAKRDRSVWSGDLSVSLRTMLVSRNYDGLSAIKNDLQNFFYLQDRKTGYFPWGGSPIADLLQLPGAPFSAFGSDTYHLYTILAYCQYYLVTSDQDFAVKYWPNILRGIQATYQFVDPETGLFNSTRTEDWGRANQGGENTAVNALFYASLNYLIQVSSLLPNVPSDSAKWQQMAPLVKKSANALLYDANAGFYVDNSTTSGHKVYPQDCNVLAITHNLTDSAAQAATITKNLRSRWTKYGAPTPELPGTISPFITSSELQAQFMSNPQNSSNGVALAKLQWGYMLQAFSSDSMVEGYATDGSLNYGFDGGRPSFVSLAHGWSTGPTWSFLEFIVGIRGTVLSAGVEPGKGGQDWIFQPQIAGSGLTSAEGGYEIPNVGKFEASWKLETDEKGSNLQVTLNTPCGTTGLVMVPLFGECKDKVKIEIDGCTVSGWTEPNGYAEFRNIAGGNHSITMSY